LGDRFATTGQATPVDMLLEASRLTPLAVHASQLFGEGPTASLTIKATTGKMQKRALAPNIQITHTPFFPIVVCHRNLVTTRTDCHLILVRTVEMENCLFTSLLHTTPSHNELWQIQQVSDCDLFDLLDCLPHAHLDGPGGIFRRLDNNRQQGYVRHLLASSKVQGGE
jgi:hypothetical protein